MKIPILILMGGASILPVPNVTHYQAPPVEVVEVRAVVTAYTSSEDETDDSPFITASGEKVGRGVAACPSKYRFGQRVKIADQFFTCLDRMNSRYRNGEYFDIWVASKSEAYNWGRQELLVTINQ